MIVLIFPLCSLSRPDDCGEKRLQFAETMSPMQCAMAAQPYLAQFVVEHPDYRVARWRCAYAAREQEPT